MSINWFQSVEWKTLYSTVCRLINLNFLKHEFFGHAYPVYICFDNRMLGPTSSHLINTLYWVFHLENFLLSPLKWRLFHKIIIPLSHIVYHDYWDVPKFLFTLKSQIKKCVNFHKLPLTMLCTPRPSDRIFDGLDAFSNFDLILIYFYR